jgi:hypothetical protein
MQTPSVDQIKSWWTKGNHRKVSRWLPHLQHNTNPFIINLLRSNLLYLGEKIKAPSLTFGADPEFILSDQNGDIVLWSSLRANETYDMSALSIGADYGLMEIRTPVCNSPIELQKSIKDLLNQWNGFYNNVHEKKLSIEYKEAVYFNHKLNRLREQIQKKVNIDYGGHRNKNTEVWNAAYISNNADFNLFPTDVTMSAYDKMEVKPYNPEIISAGGHIHLGGTFITSLNHEQLKSLIRMFDKKILPICETVGTPAAQLRKEVYGCMGEFRIKDYGIEYRSPSNAIFWPQNLTILLQVLDTMEQLTKSLLFEI